MGQEVEVGSVTELQPGIVRGAGRYAVGSARVNDSPSVGGAVIFVLIWRKVQSTSAVAWSARGTAQNTTSLRVG